MEHSAKTNIVYATELDSQHMVPWYELFIGHSSRFQIGVLAWVLPDNYDIYGQYNSSFENVFLSNLVNNLNSYNACHGKPDNLSIDYALLAKHALPEVFMPFQENKLPYVNIFFIDQMSGLYLQKLHCVLVVVKNKRSY